MSRLSDFHRNEVREVEQQDSAWFSNQFTTHDIEHTVVGEHFVILCPFHPDQTPSLEVHQYGGYFYCFSCGAGGGWNKLAHKLGLEKLARSKDVLDENDAKSMLIRSLTKMGFVEAKKEAKKNRTKPLVEQWNGDWRGYRGQWLRAYGCVKVLDLYANVVRLGIPIRSISGELVSYTCRAVTPPDATPKYSPLRADRMGWHEKELPAKELLFQGDLIIPNRWRVVVIVEGPLDAMRLLAAGIPAVSILGTSNWSPQKRDQLSSCGLDKVFVLMDDDAAGDHAADVITRSLRGYLAIECISPPRGKDADALTPKQLDWLRARVLGI